MTGPPSPNGPGKPHLGAGTGIASNRGPATSDGGGRLQALAIRLPSFQVYLAARVVAAVAAFVVLKLLVLTLTRQQYGDWGYLRTIGAVLVPIVSLSLPASMQRFYFDSSEQKLGGEPEASSVQARADLVVSVFWLSAGSATAIGITGLVLGLTGLVDPTTSLFLGASVSGAIMIAFFDYLARTVERPWRYLANRILEFLPLMVGLGFMYVVDGASTGDSTGAFSTLWWAVLMLAVSQWLVAGSNLVRRTSELAAIRRVPLSGSRTRALVKFSAPLSGTFLVGWALSSVDVALLRHLGASGEVADYVLAVGVVAMVSLVTQAALVDWPPFFFRMMLADTTLDPHERDVLIARRLQLLLGAHVVALVGLRLLAPTAYRLLGAGDYRAGLDLIGILGLGNFFYLAGSLMAVGLSHAKKTYLTLIIFGLPALLNVGLNWWFIPEHGAVAATWTTLVSFVLFCVLGFAIGRRFYRLVQIGRVVAIGAVACFVGLI